MRIDSHDISGHTVGTQYLQNFAISEAEMTQYLCKIKMSATNCHRKHIAFHIFLLYWKML